MAFIASPVIIDDCHSSIARNIYQHLVGTENGRSPNHVHDGFYSLMQFMCTHKKASRMVGLNCPEALCTPEVRVRELGRNPCSAKPGRGVKKPWVPLRQLPQGLGSTNL